MVAINGVKVGNNLDAGQELLHATNQAELTIIPWHLAGVAPAASKYGANAHLLPGASEPAFKAYRDPYNAHKLNYEPDRDAPVSRATRKTVNMAAMYEGHCLSAVLPLPSFSTAAPYLAVLLRYEKDGLLPPEPGEKRE